MDDSAARALGAVARGVHIAAALAGWSWAWLVFDRLGDISGNCDFPEHCLDVWLPATLELLRLA